MIMSYPSSAGAATVDCQNQVRSWRLLRTIAELLIPTCNCIITQDQNHEPKPQYYSPKYSFLPKKPSSAPSSTVTGTLFGYRRGRVSLCIQTSPTAKSPVLLLELAIPTNVLAREMKGGSIRFAFECGSGSGPLLSMPSWTMYCNGRKLGFAARRKPSNADVAVMRKIENVVVGAGVASLEHDVMYLRGKFERFHGSANSESFHLVDSSEQELSFYFLRSR